VRGTLFETAFKGETVLRVQYETSSVQINYVGCQVGANPSPNTDGCESAMAVITVSNFKFLTLTLFRFRFRCIGEDFNQKLW
jgi:hypothetical protein